MTKLPSLIEIGPHFYRVSEAQGDYDRLTRICGAASGFSDHGSLEIVVQPDHHVSVKRSTLLHEVLHCVWSLRGWDAGTVDMTQEEVVTRLETGLLDVLRRNPALLRYLTAKDAI